MANELTYSPAKVIQQLLINLGLGTDPTQNVGSNGVPMDPWPSYAFNEPSLPDNCITVKNTAGKDDGRVMFDGTLLTHYGFQIRFRSSNPDTGWTKADDTRNTLAKGVYRTLVTVLGIQYEVWAIARIGQVLQAGTDSPSTKRSIHTLNALCSIRQIDPMSALWKFDATGIYDDSADGHSLTPHNGPTSVTGKLAEAIHFSSSNNSYVTTPDAADLRAGREFTITGWINVDSTPTLSIVINKGGLGGTADDEYRLQLSNIKALGPALTLITSDGSTGSLLTSTHSLGTGAWHFFAAWWDSTLAKILLQIDANTPDSVTSTEPQAKDGIFSIGNVSNGSAGSPDCAIDQVRFYTRKLSDTERAALYNGGAGA